MRRLAGGDEPGVVSASERNARPHASIPERRVDMWEVGPVRYTAHDVIDTHFEPSSLEQEVHNASRHEASNIYPPDDATWRSVIDTRYKPSSCPDLHDVP